MWTIRAQIAEAGSYLNLSTPSLSWPILILRVPNSPWAPSYVEGYLITSRVFAGHIAVFFNEVNGGSLFINKSYCINEMSKAISFVYASR